MNTLIVIGRAPCMEMDLKKIHFFNFSFDYLIVGGNGLNRIDVPVKYIATYHETDIPKIKAFMSGRQYEIIGHKSHPDVKYIIKDLFGQSHSSTTGSSALLGVCFALQQGYKKIILAGCPLQGSNEVKTPYEQFQKGWKIHKNHVLGKVKSMSGWTKEFLGEPTQEWVNEI